MTDFCVSAVKYDQADQHIEWLRLHEDLGDKIGAATFVPRVFVAHLIRKGCATFQTITRNPTTGKWEDGAALHLIDNIYLSTDRDDMKKDNLGKLPRFT